MKNTDDKLKAQAKKAIKSQGGGSQFSGFQVRLLAFKRLIKNLALPGIKASLKDKSMAVSHKKDSSDVCFDKQDLHLQRYREIASEKNLPKRKIWNIRAPKTPKIDKMGDGVPITRRAIINKAGKPTKDLDWEKIKQPQPERQYVLTRIVDFFTDR